MRRTGRTGSFFASLFINLLLNLEWSIPAWILLALHFWLDISIWWFIGGLLLWFLRILIGMLFFGWIRRSSNEKDPPKENKNPYSKKNPAKEESPAVPTEPEAPVVPPQSETPKIPATSEKKENTVTTETTDKKE